MGATFMGLLPTGVLLAAPDLTVAAEAIATARMERRLALKIDVQELKVSNGVVYADRLANRGYDLKSPSLLRSYQCRTPFVR
jgi:hypothetical protein